MGEGKKKWENSQKPLQGDMKMPIKAKELYSIFCLYFLLFLAN